MLAFTARSHIYISPHRLTRSLLSSSLSLSNIRQYNQTGQPQWKDVAINAHSWKLTHQPREPKLHWSSRFRLQSDQKQFDLNDDSTTENWDSWFETPSLLPLSQRTNSFLSDQVYFLGSFSSISMTKRLRDSSTSIEVPHKREKYEDGNLTDRLLSFSSLHCIRLVDWNLPQRRWSTTNYEDRMHRSHHKHFQFHLISYNILAQQLIEDNPFLYTDCAETHLSWHRRKDRLLREILRQDADVRCRRKSRCQEDRGSSV